MILPTIRKQFITIMRFARTFSPTARGECERERESRANARDLRAPRSARARHTGDRGGLVAENI